MTQLKEEPVGSYQPLQVQRPSRSGKQASSEQDFWNGFKKAATVQEIGAVSHVEFCPQKPHQAAVTSSTRVIVYDVRTRKVRRTYARFKDKAYCGSYRGDGKLLVAGGEDGIVQIFASDGRTLLRQLKGHQQAVHVACFSVDRLHLFTGGDDATARYWDLSSGEQLCRLDGHTDYVRAASPNPASQSIWATGGYDHQCKVWDVERKEELLSLDHGAPVEAVAYHPAGAMLISGGGTEVKIWDTLGGGELISKLGGFVKTVTALSIFQAQDLSPASSTAPLTVHLLTGCLDGNLRMFNLDKFQLDYISKFPSPILSLAVSRKGGHLIAGLSDGTWVLRSRKLPKPQRVRPDIAYVDSSGKDRRSKHMPLYKFINRGASHTPGAQDLVVPSPATKALKPYDRRLRKFQFRDALDAAIDTGDGHLVGLLLEELACRNALNAALGGRDANGYVYLLQFCRKQLASARSLPIFVATLQRLLRIYTKKMGKVPVVIKTMQSLQFQTRRQLGMLTSMQDLQGLIQPLRAGQTCPQIDLY